MNNQFEEEKKKAALINHKNELEKEEHKFEILLLILILVAFVSMSIVVYFISTNNKRERKIKFLEVKSENEKNIILLESKEKELTSNIIQIANRNSTLNDAIDKLESINENLNPSKHNNVNGVIKSLKTNLKKDTWKEFKTRFELVHKVFYTNLHKEFPELTSNEVKLCSFLKLNMSTKEISSLTGQTPHTVEVARTRLRKKLDLSNKSISLISYMENF